MLSSPTLHHLLRPRNAAIVLLVLLALVLIDVHNAHSLHDFLSRDTTSVTNAQEQRSLQNQRVYIASNHWNDGPLLRSHWNQAILDLTEALGPENVYISIFESGSSDDSKSMLHALNRQLELRGVKRSIVTDDTTHAEAILEAESGWIDTPRGERELRRIPELAKIRNRTLRQLYELAREGEVFDRILFLNDVVFNTDDVLKLLNTNDGEYAAACSLDFVKPGAPPKVYDTFVLIDSEGGRYLTPTWPYFRSRASRAAMLKNEPVPVTSCWNGMVAFDAAPFYDYALPLRFRAIDDSLAASHVEASECCLIHADNPLSRSKGVWVNPSVRVGYNSPAYDSAQSMFSSQSTADVWGALWKNRLLRWFSMDVTTSWIVRPRLQSWEGRALENRERGGFCLINEMQVWVADGWELV